MLYEVITRFALQRFHAIQNEITDRQQTESEQSRVLEGLKGQLEQGDLTLEEMRLQHVSVEKEVTLGQEKVFHLTSEIQRVEGQIGFGGKEAA